MTSRREFLKHSTVLAAGLPLVRIGANELPRTAPSGAAPESTESRGLWSAPVRGSWIRLGPAAPRDVELIGAGVECEIVVGAGEHTACTQAARFLAGDIEAITGRRPLIVATPTGGRAAIRLVTLGQGDVPWELGAESLRGQWEAYRIVTRPGTVWLIGSDSRGTAYAAYTLAERLGIDPLHVWTGFRPERRDRLTLMETEFAAGPPTFRYRGFFHDDEDILPRPFEDSGYPLRIGDVPTVWYERFFETALRLRMNMVAPYTRVHRRYEVQKLASDWGLFYTSHHYDILLSNPFGMTRFNLAAERGVDPTWDWFTNREGMSAYWRAGVLENRDLHAIWPVGLRGTDDHAYAFPRGTSPQTQDEVFKEAIRTQVQLVRELARHDEPPVFQFTLYTEMLEKYERDPAAFGLPDNVIVVWPDDNLGRMRALPKSGDHRKHGVYYHLAYNGGDKTMQSAHIVAPSRVAEEFEAIVQAGATEFMLLNVSELREFVMEARMIAEICWDAGSAFAAPRAAARYTTWWSREYFGEAAAADITAAYAAYHDLLDAPAQLWSGADAFQSMLDRLYQKTAGAPVASVDSATVEELRNRSQRYAVALAHIAAAEARMSRIQYQFLFEHVALGMLFDARPTEAALVLARAVEAPTPAMMWRLAGAARAPLEQLEIEVLRAERPPFEQWYRKTWIRRERKPSNVHRSYEELRAFLASGGREQLVEPEGARFLSEAEERRYFPLPAPPPTPC